MQETKIKWFLLCTVFSVNLLSFTIGNAYAFTSPVIPKLQGEKDNPLGRPINTLEESWIASLLSLGATIGPIIGGALINKIGRKNTLLIVALPITLSNLILAFAQTVELYYFARILLGLGVGSVFSVIPIYVGEIAEASNRGALGIVMNIMMRLGNLLVYAAGPYITIQMLSFYCVIPCLLFFLSLIFLPESPYYLVYKGKEEAAEEVLEKLRNGPSKNELEEIKRDVKNSNNLGFRDILKSKATIKALWISCGLMFFQQLSGFTAVISFMHSIFSEAGTTISSELSTTIVGAIMFLLAFVTAQLIDKLGRRILLLISFIGIVLSLSGLGIFFYLKTNNYDTSNLSSLPIISIMVYFTSFNFGIGPVPWAMLGELFELHMKPFASTVVGSVCLFSAFIITMFYPNFSAFVGIAESFWLFAVCSLLGCLFVLIFVPETKNKSFNEIQIMLGGEKINE